MIPTPHNQNLGWLDGNCIDYFIDTFLKRDATQYARNGFTIVRPDDFALMGTLVALGEEDNIQEHS